MSAYIIPPMIWLTQYNYTDNAVLLVLASDVYDPDDYIRQYDDYLSFHGAKITMEVPFLDMKSPYLELKRRAGCCLSSCYGIGLVYLRWRS
jgi:hypothetical protein